uniref:SAM-dependent methyltransferase n=1 Tax=Thermosporothrix sp. COM3 TaxID=2490863 RepID=A0A455SSN3_9CHLR|nr:SAM-dependent methyltransferase [Thermosporothrix sp. COM3]
MTATPLQQRIIERIQQEGPLTFAQYMRIALYEPELGYYVSNKTRVGWEGDFYTSTDVSSLFAACAGRQLQQLWEALDHPSRFVVVEQGAGRGDLGHGVRSWAERTVPELAAALDYYTTDIGTGQDALDPATQGLQPHVLLSNELVDAFPVHVLEKRGDILYELYVDQEEGRLCGFLSEPENEEVSTYLDRFAIPWRTFPDGWRAEVNLDALHWIANTARWLQTTPHGFLLTIDYGEKARQLYTPERPRGTLACYYRHTFTEQPLAKPGEQDITAHVNFSALIDEGERHGLHLHTYTTQAAWLQKMGIFEELEQIRKHDFAVIDSTERASDQGQTALFQWYNLRQRVLALTDPRGMGNFKVLILQH